MYKRQVSKGLGISLLPELMVRRSPYPCLLYTSQGPEELNIIVGVDSADFEKAIRVLYNSFVK